MHERFDGGPNVIRDLLDIAACIDCDPRRSVIRASSHLARHPLKHLSDLPLHLFLLVPLLAVPAALSCLFGRDVEEEREIWRGEGDLWRAAPCVGEAFGVGEGDSGEGVAVGEDEGGRGIRSGIGSGANEGLLDGCALCPPGQVRIAGRGLLSRPEMFVFGGSWRERGRCTYASSHRFAEKRRWIALSSRSDWDRR